METSGTALTHPVVSFRFMKSHSAMGRFRVLCFTTAIRDRIVKIRKYVSVKDQIQIHVDNTTEPMAEMGCAVLKLAPYAEGRDAQKEETRLGTVAVQELH